MTPTCLTCRYWSDMQAEERGGVVWAKCLNSMATYAGQHCPPDHGCPAHEQGEPVDLHDINAELRAICAAQDSAHDHAHAQEPAHGH